MSEPEITLIVTPSLLTQPLVSGAVKPTGIKLRVEVAKSVDETSRRLPKLDYDLMEVDIATYVRARDERIPVIALPLFASGRRFLQRGILWSSRSGIRDLKDLPGRSAVTPQYWMASAVWQRKLLGITYRVDPDHVSWVTLQAERLPNMNVPSAIMHRLDQSGRNAEELARTGSTDIVLLPDAVGPAFAARRMGAAPPAFVPAFSDPKAAEKQFFEQFGIFPITNVVIARQQLIDEQSGMAESICEAFAEAKAVAQKHEQPSNEEQPGPGVSTTWMKNLLGDDPWPYGVGANEKTINSFLAAARMQLLNIHRFEVEELFVQGLPEKF